MRQFADHERRFRLRDALLHRGPQPQPVTSRHCDVGVGVLGGSDRAGDGTLQRSYPQPLWPPTSVDVTWRTLDGGVFLFHLGRTGAVARTSDAVVLVPGGDEFAS